jgi:hypothetical protein
MKKIYVREQYLMRRNLLTLVGKMRTSTKKAKYLSRYLLVTATHFGFYFIYLHWYRMFFFALLLEDDWKLSLLAGYIFGADFLCFFLISK